METKTPKATYFYPSPDESLSAIFSIMVFTESSTSLYDSCPCEKDIFSIRSDLVIFQAKVPSIS